MDIEDFNEKIKGWFIGDFEKATHKTKDFEVCFKEYKEGDYEDKHVHKIAKEITLVVKGEVMMNGKKYKKGDIIVMHPGEPTDFKALTDAANVVVKIPSVIGDKYPA